MELPQPLPLLSRTSPKRYLERKYQMLCDRIPKLSWIAWHVVLHHFPKSGWFVSIMSTMLPIRRRDFGSGLFHQRRTGERLGISNAKTESSDDLGKHGAWPDTQARSASVEGSMVLVWRLVKLIRSTKSTDEEVWSTLKELERGDETELSSLKSLCEALAVLHLAIVQAGAYVGKFKISFSNYHSLYRKAWKKPRMEELPPEISEIGPVNEEQRGMLTTWFMNVASLSVGAKPLLRILSMLGLWIIYEGSNYSDKGGWWRSLRGRYIQFSYLWWTSVWLFLDSRRGGRRCCVWYAPSYALAFWLIWS